LPPLPRDAMGRQAPRGQRALRFQRVRQCILFQESHLRSGVGCLVLGRWRLQPQPQFCGMLHQIEPARRRIAFRPLLLPGWARRRGCGVRLTMPWATGEVIMMRCRRLGALGKAGALFCMNWLLVQAVGCSAHQDGMHGAGAPEEARVARGEACARDEGSRSGFCDRGRCGEVGESGNYGRECVALLLAPEPPLREGIVSERTADGLLSVPGPKVGWRPEDTCGGYLCLDERCRSCQSDSECQGWLSGPRCASADGSPGKRCGGVVDAELPDAAPASTLAPRPAGS
jgi:hypothetical protein